MGDFQTEIAVKNINNPFWKECIKIILYSE